MVFEYAKERLKDDHPGYRHLILIHKDMMLTTIKEIARKVIPGVLWRKLRSSYHKLLFYFAYFELKFIIKRVSNGLKRKTILFYPDIPLAFHEIYKICRLLGYRKTNKLSGSYCLAFNWHDTTFMAPDEKLIQLSKRIKVVNIGCVDISKKRVEGILKEVFGYSTFIDPFTFLGECVKKSDLNAQNSETILLCPVKTLDESFIYQRLINNVVDGDLIQDIAVPILNGRIPFVYLRSRPLAERFDEGKSKIEVVGIEKVVTEEEKEKILVFCAKIGLEYGEVEMIRAADDKKLYIIDVNNTPIGPWGYLLPSQRIAALKRTAEAFEEQYLLG